MMFYDEYVECEVVKFELSLIELVSVFDVGVMCEMFDEIVYDI